MTEFPPSGELRGEDLTLDAVDYELDHDGEGQYQAVVATFDLGFAEFDVRFDDEQAELFILQFRDELVKAKQAKLEWQTNTDPDSGVAETDGGGR